MKQEGFDGESGMSARPGTWQGFSLEGKRKSERPEDRLLQRNGKTSFSDVPECSLAIHPGL
jgi:hypothetical protein